MDKRDKKTRLKNLQINNALGVFMFLFGWVVFFSTWLSETTLQKATNLTAALLLIGIGGGMVLYARKTIKKYNLKNNKTS